MKTKTKLGFLKLFLLNIIMLFLLINAVNALNIGEVYGEAVGNINSFKLKINVIIEGSDSIAKEDVEINGYAADDCQPNPRKAGSTLCFRTIPSSTFTKPGEFSYIVVVGDSAINEQGSLVLDLYPPEITLTCPKQSDLNKAEIEIPYTIKDYACKPSDGSEVCKNKCSGISKIEYWLSNADEENKPFYDIQSGKNNCVTESNKNNKKIIFTRNNLRDGTHSIIVKVIDQATPPNEIQQQCEITIDKTPPQINLDSFKLTKNDVEIKSFASHSVDNVVASVNIAGDDSNPDSVEADLSKLTGTNAESDKAKKASCTSIENGGFKCEWTITLNPKTPYEISISASDNNGNSDTKIKTLTLQEDNSLELDSIERGKPRDIDGETFYFGSTSGNTVEAIFKETTGLIPSDVFLTTGKSASSCITENSKWKCSWENVQFSLGNIELGIKSDSADILGNKITNSEEKITVIVDDSKPAIESIKITSLPGQQAMPELEEQVAKDNAFKVEATVISDTPVTATADFSEVGVDSVEPIDCELIEDGKWKCSWSEIRANKKDSSVERNIIFTFTNTVGSIEETRTIEVLPPSSEEMDLWDREGEVKCYPDVLSRKIGTFVELASDCAVILNSGDGAESLSISLEGNGCTTTEPDAVDPVKEVKVSHNTKGTTSPVLTFTFRKGADTFKIDEAEYTCTLNIVSKYKNQIIQTPEKETFTVKFKFAELPLGSLDENWQRQITDTKKGIKGRVETVNDLKKVLGGAEKICGAFSTIQSLKKIQYATGIGLKSSACASAAGIVTAPAAPALEEAGATSCSSEMFTTIAGHQLQNTLGWACSYFVNCENPLYGQGILNKFGEAPGMSYVVGRPNDPGYEDKVNNFLDPKRSLGLSLATGCLPGIVYGIDKFNQIQCTKVHCLEYNLQTQKDPQFCEELENYQMCKYGVGELFSIIPYVAVWNHLKPLVQETLKNPFAIGALGLELACQGTCFVPDCGSSYGFCESYKLFNEFTKVISGIGRARDIFLDPNKLFQRPEGAVDACSTIDFEGIGEDE